LSKSVKAVILHHPFFYIGYNNINRRREKPILLEKSSYFRVKYTKHDIGGFFVGKTILWAAGGTGFTFLMTSLGAALVFFFRRKVNEKAQKILLGFAAGVMIAASVWSLLIPAIEEAEAAGNIGW